MGDWALPLPTLFHGTSDHTADPGLHFGTRDCPHDLWVAELGDTAEDATFRVSEAEQYTMRLRGLVREPISLVDSVGIDESAVSFSAQDVAAIDSVREFLKTIANRVGRIARIETRKKGVVVAVTEVDLGGDTRNRLSPAAASLDVALHGRTVTTVLGQRTAWVSILIRTMAMGLRVMTAATTGVGVMGAWSAITRWLLTLRNTLQGGR